MPSQPVAPANPAPRYIDLQVNGFAGIDFSDPELTADQVVQVGTMLAERATVGFLATLVTSDVATYRRNLRLLAGLSASGDCPGLLGVHLEGPFISPQPGAVGAHQVQWVRKPDLQLMQSLVDWADGSLRMLTVAAELPGIETLIGYAAAQGVVVSLGHQLADVQIDAAARAGARAATHLGNGLPHQINRHLNPIFSCLANPHLAAMVIADGHHLPQSLLRVIIAAKGVGSTVVVSDCAPAAGLPPGEYVVFGSRVRLTADGRLFNPETGYLAGSAATMADCAAYLAGCDWLTADDIAALTYHNPRRLIAARAD